MYYFNYLLALFTVLSVKSFQFQLNKLFPNRHLNMQNKELGLVQYPMHCTRCNSPFLLSQHFFHFSLFQFFNFFFLTFFNQWLRLKIDFCNYQSQLFIRIASNTMLQMKNKKQLSTTQTQCLKPAKLSLFGNSLFT